MDLSRANIVFESTQTSYRLLLEDFDAQMFWLYQMFVQRVYVDWWNCILLYCWHNNSGQCTTNLLGIVRNASDGPGRYWMFQTTKTTFPWASILTSIEVQGSLQWRIQGDPGGPLFHPKCWKDYYHYTYSYIYIIYIKTFLATLLVSCWLLLENLDV